MSLLVAKAKEQVSSCVLNAAKTAMEKGILENAELSEFTVTVPQNREHGDWAVNAAMVWAKAFH
ncbi:MAG: arginine--tRNA ligase, partial [Acutalibacteraceae bacterium]|nr:arginine--tRNA ligase [Acutalibacteraceae bacterium]